MKKLLVAIALFGLLSLPAFAQDTPALEIYGGYQLVHDSGADFEVDSFQYHGFTAAVEGNLTSFFGIVGEFGYFKHTESVDNLEASIDGIPFLFGPRVGYRSDRFRVFGHYLLGGLKSTLEFDSSELLNDTSFAQAIGGGIDINLAGIFAIRPAQIDLLSVRYSEGDYSSWSNYFRYSGGVVLKF